MVYGRHHVRIKDPKNPETGQKIGDIIRKYAAASLLICVGAVLGRLKMSQYILLGLFFVPCYALNEWIVLNGGLCLIQTKTVVDTGGSIVIHAFGAIFGLAVAVSMTTKKEYDTPIECDETSDKYSLLGSMVYGCSGPVSVQPLLPLPMYQKQQSMSYWPFAAQPLPLILHRLNSEGNIRVAAISGLITGKIVSFFGRRSEPYLDHEEFDVE